MVGTAQELIDISREQGFTFPFAVGNIVRGWCLCAQGEAAEGDDLLLQGEKDGNFRGRSNFPGRN